MGITFEIRDRKKKKNSHDGMGRVYFEASGLGHASSFGSAGVGAEMEGV